MAFDPSFCEGCPIAGRHRPMQPVGPADARFLVVTDRPSFAAAREGRLMGPQAMQIFSDEAIRLGFGKSDFRFTPMCHCAYDPDEHHNKEKAAIHKHCRVHLLREMEAGNAEVVVPLGADATSQVFGKSKKTTKVRGLAQRDQAIEQPIFPLLSPGLVARYPQNGPLFAADMDSFGRFVDAAYDADNSSAMEDGSVTYERVHDLEFLIEKMESEGLELISFDTENTGLRWYQTGCDVRTYRESLHRDNPLFKPRFQILTMQFCVKPGEAYLLVWDHPEDPIPERDKPKLRNQLRRLLCKEDRIVIGQNTKYDNMALWMTEGIRFRIGGDTQMLATLHDENMLEKNLDVLTKLYVPAMAGYADRFNATVDKSRMWQTPIENIIPYGCGDGDASYRVYEVLEGFVMQDDKLWNHHCRVSIPGLNAFSGLESRGMFVDDTGALAEFKELMQVEVAEAKEKLLDEIPTAVKRDVVRAYAEKNRGADVAERALSFTRKDFIKEVLFTHPQGFRLKPVVFTKSTARLKDTKLREPSTSAKDHLPFFFESCPFTQQLAEYVKDESLLSKSVVNFEEKYIVGGKVRPIYNLHKAVTGRCLPGDARVVTNYGTMTMLEIGEFMRRRPSATLLVLTHANRFSRVTDFIRNGVKQTYIVRTTDGRTLRATGNHPFLSEDGWVEASSLAAGARVFTFDFDFTRDEGPEEWRNVPGDSRYRVSSSGNVAFVRADGTLRLLSPSNKGKWGHVKVKLGRNGKDFPVHRLVAEAFHGSPLPGQECRHLNGMPADNRASNLAWGTSEENAADMIRHGRSRRGERSNQCHLSDEDIEDIRTRCAAGEMQKNVGALYGIHQAYVSQIVRRVRRDDTIEAFRLSEIESVTPYGMESTYDISVEDDHSFVAENFVVHNTSSEDPNGQNYPKRGARAKAYRKMFVAPEGYYVFEIDLSQAELRIAASMARERTMIDIYRSGGDIHMATACIVLGVTEEQFAELDKATKKDGRQKAKAVNFGFLYGMGWRKFIGYAKTQYGVEFTEEQAQRVRVNFFRKYRGLEGWHKNMRDFASENKYVRSFSGRVRHLPMIDSADEGIRMEAERQAINSPVQEFGSSLGVMALGLLNEEIDSEYLQMVGFIHDALVGYCRKEHLDWALKTVKRQMQNVPLKEWFGLELPLPIVADVGFGTNLGEIIEIADFGEFKLDEMFDYSRIKDKDGKALIRVPRQVTPPNGGRLTRSVYTLPEEQEDETVVRVVDRRPRVLFGVQSKGAVLRQDRSKKQMVINRRNRQIREEAARTARATPPVVVRRRRPA